MEGEFAINYPLQTYSPVVGRQQTSRSKIIGSFVSSREMTLFVIYGPAFLNGPRKGEGTCGTLISMSLNNLL